VRLLHWPDEPANESRLDMEKQQEESGVLYQVICASFCVIAVLSNMISVKMVKLPFFADFNIPAGLFTYPLTFLLGDLVTEVYGAKKARLMVYIALGMNVLQFVFIQVALIMPASTPEEQKAFEAIMGLSGLRIFSSLTAYIVAQLAGIYVYALIKRWTNSRHLWLRNNGATIVAQILDTVIVDIIFLYWGLNMGMDRVMPIMVFSYVFKTAFGAANTPLLYLFVYLIEGRRRWPSRAAKFENLAS